jgi:hypothetical protein
VTPRSSTTTARRAVRTASTAPVVITTPSRSTAHAVCQPSAPSAIAVNNSHTTSEAQRVGLAYTEGPVMRFATDAHLLLGLTAALQSIATGLAAGGARPKDGNTCRTAPARARPYHKRISPTRLPGRIPGVARHVFVQEGTLNVETAKNDANTTRRRPQLDRHHEQSEHGETDRPELMAPIPAMQPERGCVPRWRPTRHGQAEHGRRPQARCATAAIPALRYRWSRSCSR